MFWGKPWLGESGPILAMVATFFLWRRVGGFLQHYVTTRPASPGQIASGIAAAEQLMERYQMHHSGGPTLPHRIWNMGLLQVLAGWSLVVGAIALLGLWIELPAALRLF
jgi:hypothetical protein